MSLLRRSNPKDARGEIVRDAVRLNKLTSPGSRPRIKLINASHEAILSDVSGNCGATVLCEASTGNVMPGIVYRELCDGNGPTRLGYVAYWRRNNDNPALKQFLMLLDRHLR